MYIHANQSYGNLLKRQARMVIQSKQQRDGEERRSEDKQHVL